jgi:hypothetical protein
MPTYLNQLGQVSFSARVKDLEEEVQKEKKIEELEELEELDFKKFRRFGEFEGHEL